MTEPDWDALALSIAPLRYQTVALVCWHLEFLDRGLDRRFLIGLLVDEADEPGRRALEVIDGPRMEPWPGRAFAIARLGIACRNGRRASNSILSITGCD